MRSCCCGSVCSDCLLSSLAVQPQRMETGQKMTGRPPLAAGLAGTGWEFWGCPGLASRCPMLGSHGEAVRTETVPPGGCEQGVV